MKPICQQSIKPKGVGGGREVVDVLTSSKYNVHVLYHDLHVV